MKEVAYTLDVKPGTVAFHKLAVGKTAPELIGEFCRLGNEPPFYQKPRLSAKAEGRHRLRSHRRLNFSRMNRPFASFEFLNRGLDIRLLEASSLRKIYVFLLLDVFMLGACTFMLIYGGFRFHRFDWLSAILFVTFVFPVVRYSRLVYRRLDD